MKDRQPHRGQQAAVRDAALNMAWVRVVSTTARSVTVHPAGDPERTVGIDGWLTTADPELVATTAVQIGGPRLQPGDIALVVIYGGHLLALGRRAPFVIRPTASSGMVLLNAVPTNDGARLTWGITPLPSGALTWDLYVDNEIVLNDTRGVARRVTGQEPGSDHTATVDAYSDGVLIGSATAEWTVLGDKRPPALTIVADETSVTSVRVRYTVDELDGNLVSWSLTADGTQVASGSAEFAGTRTYSHTSLDQGSTHDYVLSAVYEDANDVQQTVSVSASVTLGEIVAPVVTIEAAIKAGTRNTATMQYSALGSSLTAWRLISESHGNPTRRSGTGQRSNATYEEAGLDAGTHTFRIEADYEDADGVTQTVTAQDTVTVADVEAPSVAITATADSTTAVSGSYSVFGGSLRAWRLYRDDAQHRSGTTAQPAGTFTHTGLTPGSAHTYRIEADYLALDGTTQTVQDSASVTLPEPEITSFAGTPDGVDAVLTWTTSNCESLVLERKVDGAPDSTYAVVHTPSAAERNSGSYTDTPPSQEGTVLSFVYRLVCGALMVTAPVTVAAEVAAPEITSLSAVPSLVSTTIAWTVDGGGITGQTLDIQPVGGTAQSVSVTADQRRVVLSSIALEDPDWVSFFLDPSMTFTATVTATNAAGTDSRVVMFTTPGIDSPRNFRCESEETRSVTLAWERGSGVGLGLGPTQVRWRASGAASWGDWTNAAQPTSFNETFDVTGLTPDTTYEFQARHRIVRPDGTDAVSLSVYASCATAVQNLAKPVISNMLSGWNGPLGVLELTANWSEDAGGETVNRRELQIRKRGTGAPNDPSFAWQTITSGMIIGKTTVSPPPWLIRNEPELGTVWSSLQRGDARVRYGTSDGWSEWSNVIFFLMAPVAPQG